MRNGRLGLITTKGPNISNRTRWLMSFIGGVIFLYGARLARGCTSGQALSGSIGKAFLQADGEGKKLTAKNTTNVIAKAELEQWRKTAQPLADAWVADMNAKGRNGAKMLEDAKALIARHAGK